MDLLLPFHSRLVWHLKWPYGVVLPTNLQGKATVVNLHDDLEHKFGMTRKQATIFKVMIFLQIYAFLATATSFYFKALLHTFTVDFWWKNMHLQGFGGWRTQAKHRHWHLTMQKAPIHTKCLSWTGFSYDSNTCVWVIFSWPGLMTQKLNLNQSDIMSERLSSPREVTSGNFTSDVDKCRALKLISIFYFYGS